MGYFSRPSPAVRKLPTRDGLLLIDTATDRLLAYNDSARAVWQRLASGYTGDALVADFAAQFSIPLDVARRDVDAILQQWHELGLIGSKAQDGLLGSDFCDDKDSDLVASPAWSVRLTFTIRDTVFSFAAEPPNLAVFADIFLRHLETPGASASVSLEVRSAAGGPMVLLVDGHERIRTGDGGQLIGAINTAILEHLHPGIEWIAMIHGAAVARRGCGIALPAACGSGKTTLTAFLLASGYDYLADDLIALAAPDGRIVPWPMPISIKEGSWKLLTELYRDLPNFPQYRTKRGNARQFIPSPRVWDADAVPFRWFVFPRYVPGAAAELKPISATDALHRLLSDRLWFGYPITEHKVMRFLEWLEDKPAFDLTHGNAADAVRLIENIR